MFSYKQERKGFSYFYIKRRVLKDGVHTVPLDIVLCPYPATEDQQKEQNNPTDSVEFDAQDRELIEMLANNFE